MSSTTPAPIELERLEGELPSGRKFIVSEITGNDELTIARAVGTAEGMEARNLSNREQVLRSLRSLDGQTFDGSLHTSESLRKLFSTKDWQALMLATMEVSGLTDDEVRAFQKTFRRSTEG